MRIVNTYHLGPVRIAETDDGWTLVFNAMAGPRHGRFMHGHRGDDPDDMQYLGDDGCPDLSDEQARAMLVEHDRRG